MKIKNALFTAFAFTGLFLGAGYVSGQELYQFFTAFGIKGIIGMVFSVMLHVFFVIITCKCVNKTNITEYDKLICKYESPVLRNIIIYVEGLFLLGIVVIMTSGAASLISDAFGISFMLSSALFCLLCLPVLVLGVGGMMGVFSFVVPALCVFVVLFAIYLLKTKGLNIDEFINTEYKSVNPLLSNFALSALAYVSHNMVCAIPIVIPIAVAKKNKNLTPGFILGGVMLLGIALCIALCMIIIPESVKFDLPMLECAKALGKASYIIYAVLLFFGMYSAYVSTTVGFLEFLKTKLFRNELSFKKNFVICLVITIICWVLSQIGFSDLIATIYPISGYFGFLMLILLLIRYFSLKNIKE